MDAMIERASANCTDRARERWLLRMRDPAYQPPRVTKEQPMKEPGSQKLILGHWVEVKPDDDDAVKNGAGPIATSGG